MFCVSLSFDEWTEYDNMVTADLNCDRIMYLWCIYFNCFFVVEVGCILILTIENVKFIRLFHMNAEGTFFLLNTTCLLNTPVVGLEILVK